MAAPKTGGGAQAATLGPRKMEALNRLRTVRGHLDGIVRMLEEDAYCVDLMKQISAVQSSLERVNRLILGNHLETCFTEAVLGGRGPAAIEELLDAVKFSPALTGPGSRVGGTATGEGQRPRAGRRSAGGGATTGRRPARRASKGGA